MGLKKLVMTECRYLGRRQAALLLMAMAAALMVSGGVALAATITCKSDGKCFGTENADILNGTGGNNYMYGLGGGDTLKGRDGHDELYGQGGGDKLFGGPDIDFLIGGPGNDELHGGDGASDYYWFGDGWGNDSITDSTTSPNGVDFREQPNAKPPVLVTEDLTIRLNSGAGPEVKNESGTDTVDWDDSVITSVYGGSGDDKITGNLFANNNIRGFSGKDTIFGGFGNDTIHVGDSSGGDKVDCGEGIFGVVDHDTVYYDPKDTISTNCEEKVL